MDELTRTITVMGQSVVLDRSSLSFSEATLSEYIEKEGAFYDYFGAKLADAERQMGEKEHSYEVIYSERFKEHKDNSCSDKLAESNSKADEDVILAKEELLDAKHNVKLLLQHLRAWDKNHENAQSRGHFLRKEMDKLNKDVYNSTLLDSYIKEPTPEELEKL